MTNWYSTATSEEVERLLEAWPDAPTEAVELCEYILGTARDQVIAFAPTTAFDPLALVGLPDYTKPAVRLVLAQLQQAKNLWNAGRAQQDGNIGDTYSFIPRPLDKTIQQMIRPRRAVPSVF